MICAMARKYMLRRCAWAWNSLQPCSLATFASRSLATQVTNKPASFPSWMREGVGRISVPLNEPLPGIEIPASEDAPTVAPVTEQTILPNGFRIVSEATPGPTASLGIYVNSGSIYENSYNSGSSALLECLAFKASQNRTTLTIMKEVEKLGSTIMANASREQMAYTIDCLKIGFPQALELLCDTVLNPKLGTAEVEEQKFRLLSLLEDKNLMLTLLNEHVVRASYKGGLGQPLIPDVPQLQAITPAMLQEFKEQNYTAPRMVLAASGIDHQQLVELARPMLEPLPSAPEVPEPTSQYQGAYVYLPGQHPEANITLGFEYKGGWRNVEGAVLMTVLQYLLGGGSSFSSGGPGKGMHSRLYTRVLNQYPWVVNCLAFNNTFNDSGIVGIQATCEPNYAQDLLRIMCSEMEAMTKPVSRQELERAQKAAISVIYNALESKATSAEDIGRQFLTYGHRMSGKEYVEMIHSVTPAAIANFVQQLLCTTPCLGVYGDNTESIKYNTLLSRYG